MRFIVKSRLRTYICQSMLLYYLRIFFYINNGGMYTETAAIGQFENQQTLAECLRRSHGVR